ncbi:MAG: fimbrillin family protein, partial [Bacteroidales bacterium]|nr:fimbrillin family protein [Bacteroidales bacterium]
MNTHIRLMLAAVIITAAACSHTDELHFSMIEEEAALSISVLAEHPTRGMITDSMLPDGAELCIGIFNPDGSNYMGKNYGHLYFKAENGPGTQIWKPSGQVLLGESEGVLYAYYPYSMYSGGDIRHIFVEADSNTQDDFMYAGPYTGLNMDNKHVDITLKHALAAIKLTTRRGSYEGAGAIRSIGLGGYCGGYQGYFDVTQGKFTEVSTGGIIYPTTSFNLSDGPNEQYIMLIPTGEP